MKNKITIGADPELFIRNKDQIISAEGYIKGTKENPYKINDGCYVQLDNVACEFNIPPAKTLEEFKKSIKFGLSYITDLLARKNLSISEESSNSFDEKELQTENAKKFGCDPDYNVWTQSVNDPPEADTELLRTVAGHIHIGYSDMEEVSLEMNEKLVKAFDLFVVLPSVLTDPDRQRRKLYGKAGCFRPKPYGVEVRSLSNFWIFDEGTMEMVWEGTQMAVEKAFSGEIDEILDEYGEEIVEAINSYDEEVAKRIITEVIEPFYLEKEKATIEKNL